MVSSYYDKALQHKGRPATDCDGRGALLLYLELSVRHARETISSGPSYVPIEYDGYRDEEDKEDQPDEMQQYQQYEEAFYQGDACSDETTRQVPQDPSNQSDQDSQDESVEAHFCSNPTTVTCQNCETTLPSGNQLHKRLLL